MFFFVGSEPLEPYHATGQRIRVDLHERGTQSMGNIEKPALPCQRLSATLNIDTARRSLLRLARRRSLRARSLPALRASLPPAKASQGGV